MLGGSVNLNSGTCLTATTNTVLFISGIELMAIPLSAYDWHDLAGNMNPETFTHRWFLLFSLNDP